MQWYYLSQILVLAYHAKYSFVYEMVRAGEKIKYCRVGRSVCHIYFALPIEMPEK